MKKYYNEVNFELRKKVIDVMEEKEVEGYAFDWCCKNYFNPWEEEFERNTYLNKLKEYGVVL